MTAFFDGLTIQSDVKAQIVTKYFWPWAKVVMATARAKGNKLQYLDLFAGPGRYQSGKSSTPLMILGKAAHDPQIREMLVSHFNDLDENHSRSLEEAISQIPGIDRLRYKPKVYHGAVNEELAQRFESVRMVPTLCFIDPWGYKGLSLGLVHAVVKDWGCDCIFFLNYNRINMGLGNPKVTNHMNALFGADRVERLRQDLKGFDPEGRETLILLELTEALKSLGGEYVMPFRFLNDAGTRTTHHLVFVCKHFKGFEIMRDVMASQSTSHPQGVPSFEYDPAALLIDKRLLVDKRRPLDKLQESLLRDLLGQRLAMGDIYKTHSPNRCYLKGNYKQALTNLEAAGRIETDPPANERRKGTFADRVVVTFP